jgi:hypothetical protein
MIKTLLSTIVKPAYAQDLEDWTGAPYEDTVAIFDTDGNQVDSVNVATFKAFEPIFRNILSIAMIAGALVCFIVLLVGGFKFMTSGGDPKKTAAAGATLTYAVLGLIMFIGSWFIMRFIRDFTGVDITTFEIPYSP